MTEHPQPSTSAVAAYCRVSTGSQSTDQQRDAILAAVTPGRWFDETASGAAGTQRPVWDECRDWLRPGDTLVVVGIDRLGRSVAEVAAAIDVLTERGVVIRSLREGIDTSTATGRMVAAILASVAEMELTLGRERRSASRQARIARGLPATRPRLLDADAERRLVRLRDQGEPIEELVSIFRVSRSTVMRTLARHRETSAA